MKTIGTIIIKPTKACNADCSYCCAPPDGAPKWSLKDFKSVFDALYHRLLPGADFIWHGGEPMLLGPDFYLKAYAYAKERLPGVRFSMQSNLLSYNARWKPVFDQVFHGVVSTSWDPDETQRTYKGDPALYSKLFHKKISAVLDDGYQPKIISTFSEGTVHLAHRVYDLALASSKAGKPYDIRLNYQYPAGRASLFGPAILPETYGDMLVEIYDRWVNDAPDFLVTPLDQMFLKVAGAESGRCPWSKGCTGHIIGLEPNFDVYNCGEFADLQSDEYRFGNLLTDGIDKCLSSSAARALAMRRLKHPESCKACIHYDECEAGCMRDSVLFERGLYGKFYYCQSWQLIFSRIKESIATGEADRIIRRFRMDPESIRSSVHSKLTDGLASGQTHMLRPFLAAHHLPNPFPGLQYEGGGL